MPCRTGRQPLRGLWVSLLRGAWRGCMTDSRRTFQLQWRAMRTMAPCGGRIQLGLGLGWDGMRWDGMGWSRRERKARADNQNHATLVTPADRAGQGRAGQGSLGFYKAGGTTRTTWRQGLNWRGRQVGCRTVWYLWLCGAAFVAPPAGCMRT
ncbi:hypothetical protein IWX90DRAFT_177045 [Phyllosticta citrichinensis]|uniref:Uncharacterized protein n=1 Tax=Phyllosticta citrichinensis TaxID=1130410 RepID=A0ABR1XVF9_9PEZI